MRLPAPSPHPWYALTVKHHHERIVAQALEGRGFESYLPLYRSFHRSGRRMQPVLLPLWPGLVFCRFDISNRLPVLTIPAVGSIVSIGRVPAPIAHSELESVETIIQSGRNVSPHLAIAIGQEVSIGCGPLRGLTGTLIESKPNCRLVVSIPLLQRAVSAEVDSESVQPVRSASRAA